MLKCSAKSKSYLARFLIFTIMYLLLSIKKIITAILLVKHKKKRASNF